MPKIDDRGSVLSIRSERSAKAFPFRNSLDEARTIMGIRPLDSLTGDIGAHRRTVHRKVSTPGMTSAQKLSVNRIRRLVHITHRGFLGRHRTPERHVKVLFQPTIVLSVPRKER